MEFVLPLLIVAVVGMIAALAFFNQRSNPGKRGSKPGKGFHTLQSGYQSGMGGGNVKYWRVPKDPDQYAKLFVPKDKSK